MQRGTPILNLCDIEHIPQEWAAILSATRGINLLTYPGSREQYAGSAQGAMYKVIVSREAGDPPDELRNCKVTKAPVPASGRDASTFLVAVHGGALNVGRARTAAPAKKRHDE